MSDRPVSHPSAIHKCISELRVLVTRGSSSHALKSLGGRCVVICCGTQHRSPTRYISTFTFIVQQTQSGLRDDQLRGLQAHTTVWPSGVNFLLTPEPSEPQRTHRRPRVTFNITHFSPGSFSPFSQFGVWLWVFIKTPTTPPPLSFFHILATFPQLYLIPLQEERLLTSNLCYDISSIPVLRNFLYFPPPDPQKASVLWSPLHSTYIIQSLCVLLYCLIPALSCKVIIPTSGYLRCVWSPPPPVIPHSFPCGCSRNRTFGTRFYRASSVGTDFRRFHLLDNRGEA